MSNRANAELVYGQDKLFLVMWYESAVGDFPFIQEISEMSVLDAFHLTLPKIACLALISGFQITTVHTNLHEQFFSPNFQHMMRASNLHHLVSGNN